MALVESINKHAELMANPALTKPEFGVLMQKIFGDITQRFIELCKIDASNAETEAEELQIGTAIQALRTKCLANFNKYFPQLSSYGRDVFTVEAAQFFDWVPYYEGDDMLTKLYRWTCYQNDNILFRYYLERSNMGYLYHVLGQQAPSFHAQIAPYGPNAPSYMVMKRDVVSHLQRTQPRKDDNVHG